MKKFLAILCAASLVVVAARAEDVVLFSAAGAAPTAWTWEDARVTLQDGKVLISQSNPAAKLGDVYLEDHFACHPDAVIEINVERVISGDYALQIMAYKGAAYLGYVDLFKGSRKVGIQDFRLRTLSLPAGTDSISLKCWVSRGGSVLVKDLRYFIPVNSDLVLFDKIIDGTATGEVDNTVWTPADAGGTLQLKPGVSFGSVLLPDRIVKPAQGTLIVQTSEVQKGTVTAQIVAYDVGGTFLSAFNAAERMTTGLSARLDTLEWPADAATFGIKLWIGGAPDCSAIIRRVLVIK
jgi:hypothetical protein